MQTVIYLFIALSLLIIVHEFGHFWVAKRCGVRVLRFSVGFGHPIWQRTGRDGTEYVLAPILLGGYVKMLDEREEVVPVEQRHLSFNRQTLLKRTAIVAAGPLANLLFALFAFWLMYIAGISGIKPFIADVQPHSVAEQTGFESGDQIVSVAGEPTPIWQAVLQALMPLAEHGATTDVMVVDENGQQRQLKLTVPELGLENSAAVIQRLGIEPLRPTIKPIIGELVEGQAAQQAGILPGDQLLSANDQPVDDWTQWVELIRANPATELEVSLLRDGSLLNVLLIPAVNEKGEGQIGAALDSSAVDIPDELKGMLTYGVLPAIKQAFVKVWLSSITTLKGLWGMLVGTVSTDNLGGLISIAQIAKSSADQGVSSFINFLAMISITLAVLNLLPIPVLDGGHLALFFVEWIRGKPLAESIQMQGQRIGLILLLSLMILAFYNDLIRLFG